MSSTTNITIDDQDFTRVHYTGSWTRGGTSSDHGGTVSSSTVVGDFFKVSFNGSAITVFGTLDSTSAGTVIIYSIDGAAPSQVTSPAVSGNVFNQQFWQSPTALTTEEEHELVVTVVNLNRKSEPGEDKNTVWFDYFEIADTTFLPASSTGSHKSTAGAIVGGVIGGALCIIVFLLLLLLLRRRRRRLLARKERKSKYKVDNDPLPDPSLDEGSHAAADVFARSRPTRSEMRDLRSGINNMGTAPSVNRNTARFSVGNSHPLDFIDGASTFVDDAPQAAPSGKKNGTTNLVYIGEAVQHVDSGSRIVDMDAIRKELPPVYSAL